MMTGFPRDTAKRHDVVNRDPLLGEALHNGASAESGGGDRPPNSAGASVAC